MSVLRESSVPGDFIGIFSQVLWLSIIGCTGSGPVEEIRQELRQLVHSSDLWGSRVCSLSKPGQCCFELFRVMQLVPQGFHDQTDQSIRNGIRR